MSCLDIQLGRETIYQECLEVAWAAHVLLIVDNAFRPISTVSVSPECDWVAAVL